MLIEQQKVGLLATANAAAQGVGAVRIIIHLISQALISVVLLIAGLYVKVIHRRGYKSSEHVIGEVRCEPEGRDCKRAASADSCSETVRCALSGEGFGPLKRVYAEREQPQIGQLVRVHTSPAGDATLEPGVRWLGNWLLVGSAVFAVLWLVTFKLRNNKWFQRLLGFGALAD